MCLWRFSVRSNVQHIDLDDYFHLIWSSRTPQYDNTTYCFWRSDVLLHGYYRLFNIATSCLTGRGKVKTHGRHEKTRQARAIPKTTTGTCDSEKPRQARAILKNHDMHVRFRKTTTGTCDSEKPRQARVIPKNHDRHVRFRKTTTGTCDSENLRQARAIPKNHDRHGTGHPEIPW